MISKINLIHCRRLINDISGINEEDAEKVMPYILKSAIILYSAEMEDALKRLVAISLKYCPFIVKDAAIGRLRELLKNFNNKTRNPLFSDIQKLMKLFDVGLDNSLKEEQKQFYSDFIKKRDKIAHNPRESITFSFDDFKQAINFGETILNYISNFILAKVTEHIKNEFS